MFKPGDHLVICDMSGEQVYRSQCVRQWDGAIVKKEYARRRHPLDLQRSPPVERPIKDARPENDVFLEYGDVTADDL